MSPRASRPRIQPDYGVPSAPVGMLTWDEVVVRLARAPTYWVATIAPDGSAHVTPVWGSWLGSAAYFSCGDATHKARNLRRDPRVTVHLDSDQGVVVLKGVAKRNVDAALERRITAAMRAKYGASAIPDTAAELHGSYYEVRPHLVLAWLNFPVDVTRFEFREPGGTLGAPAFAFDAGSQP